MDELASTIIMAPESSYWGCPDHILKLMKSLIFESSQAPKEKNTFGARKFDFWKVVWNACRGSKWVSNHSPRVADCFGTDFRPIEWIWSDFTKNENFEFFRFFCLIFKHILCINPSENGHDFDFLRFFSKMKLLIKNLKRWSF